MSNHPTFTEAPISALVTGPASLRTWIRFALFALTLAISSTTLAQATWSVESLIPDVISVRVPTTTITFDMTEASYPPEEFPARYPATGFTADYLPVQVFSNADGVWTLMLEVPDLESEAGTKLIPASQVMYRVNGGVWLRADSTAQVIYTHSGATTGWLELRLEFVLELTGNEGAGAYQINVIVSAAQEPTF